MRAFVHVARAIARGGEVRSYRLHDSFADITELSGGCGGFGA
ncbi:MAG TPA: hypothetical protein VKH15_17260 [Candidatus Acidoferrum sp.]|nr:hypothetical protein [Candidatus Acidoferrum sp.]